MVSPTSNSKENRYNAQASKVINLPLAFVHGFEICNRLKKKMKEAMHKICFTLIIMLSITNIFIDLNF